MLLGLKVMFLISLLSYLIDIVQTKKHKLCNFRVNTILFFHHFIWTFALLGWVWNDPILNILYLITIPIYLILWYINDDKCIMTEYIKRKCNLGDDYKLKYLGDYFNSDKISRTTQKIYLTAAFIFTVYRTQRQFYKRV